MVDRVYTMIQRWTLANVWSIYHLHHMHATKVSFMLAAVHCLKWCIHLSGYMSDPGGESDHAESIHNADHEEPLCNDMFAIVSGATIVKTVKGVHNSKSSRWWCFAPSEVKTVDDRQFIHVAAVKSSMRAFLTHMCDPIGKDRVPAQMLAKTDVIETLLALKNSLRLRLLGASTDSKGRMKPCRTKDMKKKKLELPEFDTIVVPDFGDVKGGLGMQVLLTPVRGKGASGIWVELKPENLQYMCEAVADQYRSGGSAEKEQAKAKRKSTASNKSKGDSPDLEDVHKDSGEAEQTADDIDGNDDSGVVDDGGLDLDTGSVQDEVEEEIDDSIDNEVDNSGGSDLGASNDQPIEDTAGPSAFESPPSLSATSSSTVGAVDSPHPAKKLKTIKDWLNR